MRPRVLELVAQMRDRSSPGLAGANSAPAFGLRWQRDMKRRRMSRRHRFRKQLRYSSAPSADESGVDAALCRRIPKIRAIARDGFLPKIRKARFAPRLSTHTKF